MIKDTAMWEAWERQSFGNEPADLARNLALMDAMYEQARLLGAVPPADLLEGLEVKIRMARVVHVPASS